MSCPRAALLAAVVLASCGGSPGVRAGVSTTGATSVPLGASVEEVPVSGALEEAEGAAVATGRVVHADGSPAVGVTVTMDRA